MKYKDGPFFQISRAPFQDNPYQADINNLSLAAFKLYIWLNELEHRYTGIKKTKSKKPKQDWFFRTTKDLSVDTNLSQRTITKSKEELSKHGFIMTWQMHWIVNAKTQQKSEKHVTAFRILK